MLSSSTGPDLARAPSQLQRYLFDNSLKDLPRSYAQRAEQASSSSEVQGRVYEEVQSFGACSSGPTLRTLDLATSTVTQVQRLDDTSALTRRNLQGPPPGVLQALKQLGPSSDHERDWDEDDKLTIQMFDRSDGQFHDVPEVRISTPSVMPAVVPAMRYGVPAMVNQRMPARTMQDAMRPPAPPGLPAVMPTDARGICSIDGQPHMSLLGSSGVVTYHPCIPVCPTVGSCRSHNASVLTMQEILSRHQWWTPLDLRGGAQ